jgi:hypothetical protein
MGGYLQCNILRDKRPTCIVIYAIFGHVIGALFMSGVTQYCVELDSKDEVFL